MVQGGARRRVNGGSKGTSNTIRPDEEDHISTLPDDVLSSILSLLSIRDAVKTSILSRRWRYLCATLPDINFVVDETFFDCMRHCGKIAICPKNNPMFVIGVSRFLNQYLGPKLRSFRVSFCCDEESTSVVDHWISLAVRMGVEKLDLQFVCNDILYCDFDDYCSYYHSMYGDDTKVEFFWWQLFRACDFLKHLCLNSCAIMLPPGSRYKVFNELSTIDLIHVPLVHNELQYIFRSCLNLESLKVRHCRLPATLCISGLARLEILVIDTCFGLVEEIELNELANLVTFEFCDPDIEKLSFSCVPKLEHVFFTRRFPQNFLEAVGNLPELKTLRISKYTYWAAKTIDSPYVLRTLKHLELFITDGNMHDKVEIIAPLLRACPLLQRLNVVVSLQSLPVDAIDN
ncbi:F-box/LRR-repeat protein At3g58900-like [Actinidia eriantha]|uniref:F-box/LRR-repeat protein At3g58900-like n=1 Tax=Actinidia eriantha TaxID=165200 RepID=UPI00258DEE2B|nr:F-box/LRR-repeat protein At3g58900-like [Actinidia eriantha]